MSASPYIFLASNAGVYVWDSVNHVFAASGLDASNQATQVRSVNVSGDTSRFIVRGSLGLTVVNTATFVATRVPLTNTANFRATSISAVCALNTTGTIAYLVGATDAKLYAINTSTGAVLLTSSVVASNTSVFCGDIVVSADGSTILINGGAVVNDGFLHTTAFRASDLALLWRSPGKMSQVICGYDSGNGFVYSPSGQTSNRILKSSTVDGSEVAHADLTFATGSLSGGTMDSNAFNLYLSTNNGAIDIVSCSSLSLIGMATYFPTPTGVNIFSGIALTQDGTKLYSSGGSTTGAFGYLGEIVLPMNPVTNYSNLPSGFFVGGSARSVGVAPPPPNPQPDPVTNLTWAGCQGPQNTLSWIASNAATYQVRRNGALIGTTPMITFIDTTAQQGVTYTYTVYGVSVAGVLSTPVSLTVTTCAASGHETRVCPGSPVTARTCPGAPVTQRVCP